MSYSKKEYPVFLLGVHYKSLFVFQFCVKWQEPNKRHQKALEHARFAKFLPKYVINLYIIIYYLNLKITASEDQTCTKETQGIPKHTAKRKSTDDSKQTKKKPVKKQDHNFFVTLDSFCVVCGEGGELIDCDKCKLSYHEKCSTDCCPLCIAVQNNEQFVGYVLFGTFNLPL
jgi:hypothetical protein